MANDLPQPVVYILSRTPAIGASKETKKWRVRVREANFLFKAYILVAFVCCLLTPESLGVTAGFGWDPAHIPIYSWIADVRGALPF